MLGEILLVTVRIGFSKNSYGRSMVYGMLWCMVTGIGMVGSREATRLNELEIRLGLAPDDLENLFLSYFCKTSN